MLDVKFGTADVERVYRLLNFGLEHGRHNLILLKTVGFATHYFIVILLLITAEFHHHLAVAVDEAAAHPLGLA